MDPNTLTAFITIVTILIAMVGALVGGIALILRQLAHLEAGQNKRMEELKADLNKNMEALKADSNRNMEGLKADTNKRMDLLENLMRDVLTVLGNLRERTSRIEGVLTGQPAAPDPTDVEETEKRAAE